MKPMRVVVSAVFVAALSLAGVAMAQVPGQPVVSRATYTVEPFTPIGQVTIQGTGVRLRSEPFSTTQAQVLSSGSTGLVLNVVGIARLPDWNWYQVVLKNSQKAFIRSDLTSAPSRGNGQAVPVTPTPVVAASIPATPAMPMPAPVAATPMPAAPTVITPPASGYTPTPPPTPQPYVPPTYWQPVPAPQPVPLAPAMTQPQLPPVTNNLPSLDLPRPSDPAGLRSN